MNFVFVCWIQNISRMLPKRHRTEQTDIWWERNDKKQQTWLIHMCLSLYFNHLEAYSNNLNNILAKFKQQQVV